jgi:hypothetical protein
MSNVFGKNLVQSVNGKFGRVKVVEDKNYVYEQLNPTNSWTINHGLNKRPSVNITDLDNNIVYGDIQYVNDNQVTITFNKPFTGKVIFN